MPAPLHGAGWLQKAVEKVCRGIVAGKVKLPEGKTATPTVIAKIIQKSAKLDAPPSSGAIAAIFDRWTEYEFAVFSEKPRAFVKFGKNGNKSLEDIRAARSAARTAARPVKAPAKKAPAKKAAAKKAPAKKAAAKKAASKK